MLYEVAFVESHRQLTNYLCQRNIKESTQQTLFETPVNPASFYIHVIIKMMTTFDLEVQKKIK